MMKGSQHTDAAKAKISRTNRIRHRTATTAGPRTNRGQIWCGVDSTGIPDWHTAAGARAECRELIQAAYTEEGDMLLSPQFLAVSWAAAEDGKAEGSLAGGEQGIAVIGDGDKD